jgi:hypothetical protein
MLTQSAIDPTALHVCRGESSFFFIWPFLLVLAKGARASGVFCRGEIDYFRFAVKKDVSLSVPTGRKGQVTGAWNDDPFFGLTGELVSLFAELRWNGKSHP